MLGICQRGFFKGELFDVQYGREGAWMHYSSEHICGLKEEDFDFDYEHVADELIKRGHLGIWVPNEVLVKVIERAPKDNVWLEHDIRFVIDGQYRNEKELQKLNELYINKYGSIKTGSISSS